MPYPNRSDLAGQPSSSVTPNARPGSLPAGARAAARSGGAAPAQPAVGPGDIPSLADPTMIPDQPIQAGLSGGPGVGPEALGIVADENPELSILRTLYSAFPNPDLRRLISYLEVEA